MASRGTASGCGGDAASTSRSVDGSGDGWRSACGVESILVSSTRDWVAVSIDSAVLVSTFSSGFDTGLFGLGNGSTVSGSGAGSDLSQSSYVALLQNLSSNALACPHARCQVLPVGGAVFCMSLVLFWQERAKVRGGCSAARLPGTFTLSRPTLLSGTELFGLDRHNYGVDVLQTSAVSCVLSHEHAARSLGSTPHIRMGIRQYLVCSGPVSPRIKSKGRVISIL